jgi:hypothetical protein
MMPGENQDESAVPPIEKGHSCGGAAVVGHKDEKVARN